MLDYSEWRGRKKRIGPDLKGDSVFKNINAERLKMGIWNKRSIQIKAYTSEELLVPFLTFFLFTI